MNRYLSNFVSLLVVLCIQFNCYLGSCDTMSSKNLQEASSTYLRLKNERGHWHNQPRNPAIDDFNGERHQAMLELHKELGQENTSADEIQRLMGPPTKILNKPDLVLEHEFKRDNYNYPEGAKIWIYEWRGSHDYIYFVIPKENQVVKSDWYQALE